MGREGRDYWAEQLAEYWDGGLTIREYAELKELPYESLRRWIRLLKDSEPQSKAPLELVEVTEPARGAAGDGSGVGLKLGGIEVVLEKGFDSATLLEVLKLLREAPCSAPAVR